MKETNPRKGGKKDDYGCLLPGDPPPQHYPIRSPKSHLSLPGISTGKEKLINKRLSINSPVQSNLKTRTPAGGLFLSMIIQRNPCR